MKTLVFSPKLGAILAAAVTLVALSACGTGGRPRDLMMEEALAGTNVERPVAMMGEGAFLDGQLGVVATVSRGFDRGMPGRGGRRGGMMEEEGRRGRRSDENPFTEVYNIYGDSEEEQKEAIKEYIRQAMARRAAGSPMPPVTLRVEFENRTTEPVVIEVTEVNSYLGNFAVRPPRLELEPGGKGVLDPMISQLGVTSEVIPLKLEVRHGGRKEQQVVNVSNVIAASLRKEFETPPQKK
jgi:hypothetical protein